MVNVAGVILAVGAEPRQPGAGARRRRPRSAELAAAALGAELAEVIVVVDDAARAAAVPDGATVLLDGGGSAASALRAAADWCTRAAHDAMVIADTDAPLPGGDVAVVPSCWRALAAVTTGPVVVATAAGRRTGLWKIAVDAWPLLPMDGAVRGFAGGHPELARDLAVDEFLADTAPITSPLPSPSETEHASLEDVAAVTALLGRPPAGDFSVVVRGTDGGPVVIRNAPFLADGTPMPTRYWLVGRREQEAVGRLESAGGVHLYEALVEPGDLDAAHERYAAERDRAIGDDSREPRPTGGVGGTRTGVKCLHAHLAWYLAGGGDPVGRLVAHRLADVLPGPVAAIDCGTNSTRLLILDRQGRQVVREMIITRLGEDVDRTGALAPQAIERTLDALRIYRRLLDEYGVVAVRATATSAARDATNRSDFFDPAAAVVGAPLELLAGEEEGRLSYAGATADLDPAAGPYLVVDIGGGSTELVAGGDGPDAPPVALVSLDVGCVRVTERYFGSDPPTPEDLAAARCAVGAVLDDALATLPALRAPRHMIGVAGTASALVAMALGLEDYTPDQMRHHELTRSDIEKMLAVLAAETSVERRLHPGIEPARADVIVGGAVVLAEVLGHLDLDSFVYSESDILDGVAHDLRRQMPSA